VDRSGSGCAALGDDGVPVGSVAVELVDPLAPAPFLGRAGIVGQGRHGGAGAPSGVGVVQAVTDRLGLLVADGAFPPAVQARTPVVEVADALAAAPVASAAVVGVEDGGLAAGHRTRRLAHRGVATVADPGAREPAVALPPFGVGGFAGGEAAGRARRQPWGSGVGFLAGGQQCQQVELPVGVSH